MGAKRAESNIDWIIAFSLFFFYVVWFFLFVKPTFFEDAKPDFLTNVEQGFLNDVTWKVYTYPVVVQAQITEANVPLFVSYDLGRNVSNIFLQNHSFLVDNEKLFFVGNVRQGMNRFFLLFSNETYAQAPQLSDLFANSETLSTNSLKASFSRGLVQSIDFRGKQRVQSVTLTFNGGTLQNTSTVVKEGTVARIGVARDELSVFTYAFSQNPLLFMFIQPSNKQYVVQMDMHLDKYASYTPDASTKRGLVYPSSCESFQNNVASFSDNDTIAFLFDRMVNISVCPKNTTLNVLFRFTITNETLVKIVFVNGTNTTYTKYFSPTVSIKTAEPTSGISLSNLLALQGNTYAALKERWAADNFEIITKNTTHMMATFGTTPPEGIDVIARQQTFFLLDKFTNVQNLTVIMRGWR